MEEQKLDWEKAEKHFTEILNAYKELVGVRGVNPLFGLSVFLRIKERYDRGERTPELFQEMMDVE